MAKPKDVDHIAPPYVPWKSFTGFLDTLKKTAVPQRIDRSLMSAMSGSTRSQMLGALRFLGLITEDGTTTEDLRRLVLAIGVPGEWKETLPDIVTDRYLPIIGNDIDLDSGTAQQLVERFRIAGKVEGSALRKAVAFYLMAQASAGVKLSPHFTTRGVRARTVTTRPRNKASAPPRTDHRDDGHRDDARKPPPKGTVRLPFVVPAKGECAIEIPENLTAPEWEMINAYIKSYIGITKH